MHCPKQRGSYIKERGEKTIIRNLRKQKCIEKERKGGNWRGFVIGWGGQHQRKILPRTEDIKRREFLMSETIERGAKIFSTPDARFNYSWSRRQGACMPQIMRLLSEGKDRGTTVTEREREKNTCGINVRGRLIQFALVVGEMCALYPRG